MPEPMEKQPGRLKDAAKAAAIKAVSTAAYWTGMTKALTALCCRPRRRSGATAGQEGPGPHLGDFQVLIYHRVHPDDAEFSLDTLTPDTFEWQMRFVKANYAVLALDEIVAMRRAGTPLPGKCLAISFDDGYRDNYLHAWPILDKHGLPATVFLTSDYVGTDRLLWFDQVLQGFKHTQRRALRLEWTEGELVLDRPGSRRRAALEVLAHLKKLENALRQQRILQLLEELKVRPEEMGLRLMLSWDEVRELLRGGMRVGSHTATHPILSRVGPEEARREIASSRQVLEKETGRKITLLAYPNGRREDFTEETVRLAREAGYEAAFTTLFKNNRPEEDLFQLGRYRPWEDHVPTFALRLACYRAMV